MSSFLIENVDELLGKVEVWKVKEWPAVLLSMATCHRPADSSTSVNRMNCSSGCKHVINILKFFTAALN